MQIQLTREQEQANTEAMAHSKPVAAGGDRKTVTSSNMAKMIDEAVAALPADEQPSCDKEKLVQFVRVDGLGCRTAEDVVFELERDPGAIKAKMVELKIAPESFYDALLKVAENTD